MNMCLAQWGFWLEWRCIDTMHCIKFLSVSDGSQCSGASLCLYFYTADYCHLSTQWLRCISLYKHFPCFLYPLNLGNSQTDSSHEVTSWEPVMLDPDMTFGYAKTCDGGCKFFQYQSRKLHTVQFLSSGAQWSGILANPTRLVPGPDWCKNPQMSGMLGA